MRVAAARRPDRETGAVLLAAAISGVLCAAYLVWRPQSLDLAAQTFRADLWDRYGWVLYNDAWYGGHTIPGYSLLYPPLGALLGPVGLGVACALISAVLFGLIGVRAYGQRAWLGIAWFGLGSTVSLYGGRLTFGLGVTFGLAAMLAIQRRRPALGALWGLLAALSSPVAGLFTVMAAAAVLIGARLQPISTPSRHGLVRAGWAVAIGAALATVALVLAFPTSGFQPFTTDVFVWIPLVCAVCFLALPVGETTLRWGIVLYAILAILAFNLTTPLGSNALRLGSLFAGPVMAMALYGRRPVVLLLIAAPLLWWQWSATVRDVFAATGDPATEASFYAPLVAELEDLADGRPIRVEIPPTRSRWEAVYVAEHIPLARGWLRQLESDDFHDFLGDRLTPTAYARWLREHGVDYVAVPDADPDYLAVDEDELIRAMRPGYLEPVWSSQDWSLWRVDAGADPALRPDLIEPDGFTVSTPGPGRFPIRMSWSPYLRIVAGEGCIEPGDNRSTTILTVPDGVGPQEVEIRATFSLDGLLRREPSCRRAGSQ